MRAYAGSVTVAVIAVLAASALIGSALASPDWLNRPVLAAAGDVLAGMPDDFHSVKSIQAEKAIAEGGVLILDVREAKEFAAEHLKGARSFPIRQLAGMIDSLPESRDAPILVYCRTGHRGAIVLAMLRMIGYTNVRSIAGGIEAWKTAGLPVEK